MKLIMLFIGISLGVCVLLLVEYLWCKNQVKKGYSLEEIWEHFWGKHLKRSDFIEE